MKEINFCDNKKLLKIHPFYNILIDFMEKPKIKRLSNVELLNELPFYSSLSIKEVSEAFRRYAKSFSIEIIDRKDPLVQLNSSKPSIKDLFKDLLYEMKGFKYQVTMNITLSKEKVNGDTEYASVYFTSITKIVINLDFEYSIDKSFEEILYRTDNWINEGSGWIVESVNSEYVNISMYSPLLGSSFIELPDELEHQKKGLINIKNKDNKCFLWCHVRHLNLVYNHSTRINKKEREIADTLDYSDINFPVSEEDCFKIEDKNNIKINVYSYDNSTTYPIYVSNKNFSKNMDLLLIFLEDKSHYVYMKDFNRLMFKKTKNKNKKYFCKYCLQCFGSENILVEHKENCLVINGEQCVKLSKGSIIFKNHSKQIHAPFKIYADFEFILKETGVSECNFTGKNSSYTKKYQNHIPCGFGYKVVCSLY